MTWTPERTAQVRARAEALEVETGDPIWDGWGIGSAVGKYIEHTPQDVRDMLDEIDRLTRELDTARTVTDEMVDRALSAYHYTWHSWTPRRRLFDTHHRTVAALTAALTSALNPDTGELKEG